MRLKVSLFVLLIGLIWTLCSAIVPPAFAASKPAAVEEIRVHLSSESDELKFVPDRLQFEAGKRYKLILDNPSHQKHYFTAKDFADGLWTQKVEAGNVEIKGAIHELELKPGAIAEWVFVPLKPGNYEVRCPIAGHTEAGMKGVLTIVD